MMKKLLSLPPNLVGSFHNITGLSHDEYFCTHDPVGHKLGSGGGTTWLLEECWREWGEGKLFDEWLASDRRILLHAGGQSRRLPAYAPSGKILTPIPVFRWERGQKLGQTLLDLQLPLYEKLMAMAPDAIHTMIVSGDVYIRSTQRLPSVPDADVVCYGLWLDASIATSHGVFVSERQSPSVLRNMLQKPSVATLNELLKTGFFLTDIGVWMLSDKAVKLLMARSKHEGEIKEYDLYAEFGCALGTDPSVLDEELRALSVAIVPLPGGEFYHYGTSREMISSTLAVQNIVHDQRNIMYHSSEPHPSIFVQNSITKATLSSENVNTWVENSFLCERWTLSHDNIITGVPQNDWNITLGAGQCVDIVPVDETAFVLRPYLIDDKFAGEMQQAKHFPVVYDIDEMGKLLNDMLKGNARLQGYELLSAEEISDRANLVRLATQREEFRKHNWLMLADNYENGVFYQLDLQNAASEFAKHNISLPKTLSNEAPLLTRVNDAMFRAEVLRCTKGDETLISEYEQRAFSLLADGITAGAVAEKQHPSLSVCKDQIVWGRSPVRMDIAGGWSDTPPYCLLEGGNVINLAIELNGQPPLQTYIRPSKEPYITLRSIDLGAVEEVRTYEQLADYKHVGSPFSIPKAALSLAGFLPGFCIETFSSLEEQLRAFGCGIELTLFSAIPAGSGLGTSSVLAATVLGAINDFCALGWGKNEICRRTLMLEQMLSTGGGWQDQYGGVFGGVKLLQTERGIDQHVMVRWLPSELYTHQEYAPCHLLYYTGITRTAKHILAEIVRKMFLNDNREIRLLREMKAHTMDMFDAIQRQDYRQMGLQLRANWQYNQMIDSGTCTPEIKALTDLIDDLCYGYKLPGAGGGGYLYMVAKDIEAAARIRHILNANRTNPNARFVDMSLSETGLQVSRS